MDNGGGEPVRMPKGVDASCRYAWLVCSRPGGQKPVDTWAGRQVGRRSGRQILASKYLGG